MAKAPVEIRSLARAHTESALRTLAGVMNEPSAPPSARVAAAQALLDRGWGKPHQTAEITHIRQRASELSDDQLAGYITSVGGEGTAETPSDSPVIN